MPNIRSNPSNLTPTLVGSVPGGEGQEIGLVDSSPLEKPATLQSALDQNDRVGAEEEKALFARLQFYKFRREALESTLETSGKSKKIHREIQHLTQEIASTRNAIAEKFLRLLASIARQLAPRAGRRAERAKLTTPSRERRHRRRSGVSA